MNILKKIDIFSRDFSFSIDGGSFRTQLGGLVSIFIGIGFVILTIRFGKDLYYKADPNYLFKYEPLIHTPYFNFTRSNFALV